jgi:hypothetical protein
MMIACILLPILERALMMELDSAAAEEMRRIAPALLWANHLEGLLGCMETPRCYR